MKDEDILKLFPDKWDPTNTEVGDKVIVFDFEPANALPIGEILGFANKPFVRDTVLVEFQSIYATKETKGTLFPAQVEFHARNGGWGEGTLCILPATSDNLVIREKVLTRKMKMNFTKGIIEFVEPPSRDFVATLALVKTLRALKILDEGNAWVDKIEITRNLSLVSSGTHTRTKTNEKGEEEYEWYSSYEIHFNGEKIGYTQGTALDILNDIVSVLEATRD